MRMLLILIFGMILIFLSVILNIWLEQKYGTYIIRREFIEINDNQDEFCIYKKYSDGLEFVETKSKSGVYRWRAIHDLRKEEWAYIQKQMN